MHIPVIPRTYLMSVLALTLCIVGVAPTSAAPKTPAEWNPATFTVDLKLGTPQEQQAALEKMKRWMEIDPVDGALQLTRQWGKVLLDTQHYDELDDWCQVGIVASLKDSQQLESLLQLRISALLASNKPQEALQAAKSFFNVASAKPTSTALSLIARCLEKAYPQDRDIYDRFRNEQVAGAATDGTAKRSKIMDSIKIDPSPYQTELDHYGKRDRADTNTIMAYGNLLLLTDQGKKAAEIFAQLGTRDRHRYVECISRAMKTEDGIIGAANAYLLTGEE